MIGEIASNGWSNPTRLNRGVGPSGSNAGPTGGRWVAEFAVMPVVPCPRCKKAMNVPGDAAGNTASCPHCQKTFLVAAKNPAAKKPIPVARPVVGSAVAGGSKPTVRQKPIPTPTGSAPSRRTLPNNILLMAGGGAAAVALLGGILWFAMSGRKPPTAVVAVSEKKAPAHVDPPKKIAAPTKVVAPPPPTPVEPPPLPPVPDASIEKRVAALIDKLNEARKEAKLPPVVVDADLSRGCEAHAAYIVLNRKNPKLSGPAGLQDEDPELPGYREEGRRAAAASMLAFADPAEALGLWLARPKSRSPLLNPDLERIGVGSARSDGGEWITVLDPTRGLNIPSVLYPAPGQTNVPLSFSGGPEAEGDAGFPVSLQFPVSASPAAVAAFLADEKGNRVPVHLSTPERPLPGIRRPGLIGMIPVQPLAPKTVYRASVRTRIDGRDIEKEWTFTTEDDGDESGEHARKMLERLNRLRRQAGLMPVALDDELSRGCRLHAKYLVMNARRPETAGLGAHHEDPKLPGYTPEGHKAGKASDIALGDYEPQNALDGWMSTFYHRIPILEPGLQKVGFGCARGQRLGWITVLDVASGRDNSPRSGPVYWPTENDVDVPLHFPPGGEEPNPIPDDKTGRAGFPITAFFPFQLPVLKSAGKLEDSKGQPVACWFSSPEKPANSMFVKHQGTSICLIPKAPLRPEEKYRVTLTGEFLGDPWTKSWTFTTAKAGPSAKDAVRLALTRLNEARASAGLAAVTLDPTLSIGCQAHADYLVRNAGLRNRKGFNVVDEDPSLPGYTPEGQEAARRGDVFSLAPSPTTQVDDLVGTLYRRSFLFDPRLRRIGLGCAHEIGAGWINVLDLNSGRE